MKEETKKEKTNEELFMEEHAKLCEKYNLQFEATATPQWRISKLHKDDEKNKSNA